MPPGCPALGATGPSPQCHFVCVSVLCAPHTLPIAAPAAPRCLPDPVPSPASSLLLLLSPPLPPHVLHAPLTPLHRGCPAPCTLQSLPLPPNSQPVGTPSCKEGPGGDFWEWDKPLRGCRVEVSLHGSPRAAGEGLCPPGPPLSSVIVRVGPPAPLFPLGHPAWSPSINLTLHPHHLPCLLLCRSDAGGCAGAGHPLAQRGAPSRLWGRPQKEGERGGKRKGAMEQHSPSRTHPHRKGVARVAAGTACTGPCPGRLGGQKQVRGGWQHPPTAREKPQQQQQHAGALGGGWCRAGCSPASPGEQHPWARWGRSEGKQHSPEEQGPSMGTLQASPASLPPRPGGAPRAQLIDRVQFIGGDSLGLGLED